MGTKRIVLLGLLLIAIIGSIFLLKPTSSKHALRVCTWSNYYPDAVLEEFSKTTGIRVELSYISSNEELFAKFKAGATGFDVIQPSDYMIRQMSRLDMLSPLDHRILTNLSNLDDFYKNLPYDPGLKFSVPFTWGTTGVAINTEKIKIPAEGVSWKILFETADPRHTSLLDDMREVFTAALLWRGKSANTHDMAALEKAKQDISNIKSKILMFTSEPKPLLLKEEVTLAQIYSSDGVQSHLENPKISYFIPKEGGTLWTDNFAIPRSSHRIADAHVFINYFLDPDNAIKISSQNHLSTPNRLAKQRLPIEEQNNPNLYPPADVLKRLEWLQDLGELMPILNRMWTELKSS